MAATKSLTADSPRRQRIFISLSSASVSVLDFFGGIAILLIPLRIDVNRDLLQNYRRSTKGLVSKFAEIFLEDDLNPEPRSKCYSETIIPVGLTKYKSADMMPLAEKAYGF